MSLPRPELVRLWCGEGCVEVDASLAHMSLPRVHVDAFRVADSDAPQVLLRVVRSPRVEGELVEGPLGRCVVKLEGARLEVEVADGPFLGELVLRLAYYLVTARHGGVLLHATGLRRGDRALVASGKSGDGKSTLSRLSTAASVGLLSDEILQLFPDGRVGGTPFRSDQDNVGAPGLVRAAYFCTLRKTPYEALEPLAPLEAASVALAQCFSVDSFALPAPEARRRVLSFLGQVELRALAFRKDPAVGPFVYDLLAP